MTARLLCGIVLVLTINTALALICYECQSDKNKLCGYSSFSSDSNKIRDSSSSSSDDSSSNSSDDSSSSSSDDSSSSSSDDSSSSGSNDSSSSNDSDETTKSNDSPFKAVRCSEENLIVGSFAPHICVKIITRDEDGDEFVMRGCAQNQDFLCPNIIKALQNLTPKLDTEHYTCSACDHDKCNL